MKFTVPVKTLSPNRVRGTTRLAAIIDSRRKAKERNAAMVCAMEALVAAYGRPILTNGYVVLGEHVEITFTRLSAGKLDPVNLAASLKAIEDGVAQAMKIDDGSSWWRATYAQRKCKRGEYGVEVKIT